MADDFDEAVRRQVERIRRQSLQQLERAVADKRRRWLRELKPGWAGQRPTPREAYELFFARYMGLDLEGVPVVSETAEKIVWRSINPCPTLEACRRLGLETRDVCRAAYERSTQAFLSAIDPELRFHRDYGKIRPHAPHCEEWIIRLDFEDLMRTAVEEAMRSLAEGNKGYGAVVVFDGEIVSRAHDTAVTESDPSLHAEVNAIRAACRALGQTNLSGAVLLSTCEPCPMCSALAVWANVTSIIFGASIQETARLGKRRIQLAAAEVASRSPGWLEVIGGVLREQCLDLYS